jgi:quercetin dioxygenase-like cupin family protein
MFDKATANPCRQVLDKIAMKTRAYGDKTLMSEFRLEQGAQLPRHSHPHEQIGYLVAGQMQLTIGSETFLVEAGDSWCIAGACEHEAVALQDSVAIKVFSPVREDYLPNS